MKLFERLKAWLNCDTIAALERLRNLSHEQSETIKMLADGIVKLANACESLEHVLSDRMDVIEGRLDEMKPKDKPEASGAVPGHRPWTQRRDARWTTHFNVDQLTSKLQKVGTDG